MTLVERLKQIRDCAVFQINAALPKDAHLAGETLDEAIRMLTPHPAITQRLEEVLAENLRLRAALATSKDPCVYCQLPAEEMAKCKSGFPGCARMDDLVGCPEFGAMMKLEELKQACVPFNNLAYVNRMNEEFKRWPDTLEWELWVTVGDVRRLAGLLGNDGYNHG